MNVLIDREQMCVRYKHSNLNMLLNMMHIELGTVSAVIANDDNATSFATFTDLELNLLHQNLCGQKYQGFGRAALLANVAGLCTFLPESELNGFELVQQANAIGADDESFYRYAKGCNKPKVLVEIYRAPPMTTQQVTEIKEAPLADSNIHIVAYEARSTGAPKEGSKTGKVWAVADSMLQKQKDSGVAFNIKALRQAVMDACEAEGINGSTASVQFSKWKQNKL